MLISGYHFIYVETFSSICDAEFVVIAAPTNYDPQKNFFDTHHIEDVIDRKPPVRHV